MSSPGLGLTYMVYPMAWPADCYSRPASISDLSTIGRVHPAQGTTAGNLVYNRGEFSKKRAGLTHLLPQSLDFAYHVPRDSSLCIVRVHNESGLYVSGAWLLLASAYVCLLKMGIHVSHLSHTKIG